MRLKYACSVAAVVGGGVVLRPSVCGATGARRRWSRLTAAMAVCKACVLCGVVGGAGGAFVCMRRRGLRCGGREYHRIAVLVGEGLHCEATQS